MGSADSTLAVVGAPTLFVVVRYAMYGVAALLSIPATRYVVGIAKEWGERGVLQRRTATQVDQLMDPEHGIIPRLSRQEYILTGDGGTNGVRGDVQRAKKDIEEVKAALVQQNTTVHTALGQHKLGETLILKRLERLEKERAGGRSAKRRRRA